MKSRFVLLSILLAASLAFSSCQQDNSAGPQSPAEIGSRYTPAADSTGEPAPGPPSSTRTFRIAFTSGLGSLPAYAARNRRWFEDRGVTVSFASPVGDSAACLDLLSAGKADVAFGVSLQSLIDAESKTPGAWRVLGFSAESRENPLGAFLVPVDSPIQTLDDLRGRRVVAAGADYAPRMATMALTGGGETVQDDIPLVHVDPAVAFDFSSPGRPEAMFVAGEVMAAFTKGLPAERKTRSLGQAPLATRFFSPFPVQAIVMRSALAREDPESVGAMAEVCDGLLEWCNTNFAETLPILQKEFALDDESTLNLFAPLFLPARELPPDRLLQALELWNGSALSEDIQGRVPAMAAPVRGK